MSTGKSGWSDLMVEGRLPRFALLCLGVWLNAADSLMTATIMPSVAADIGGYAYFGWTIAGFILGAILAGASAGQISMRLGLRLSMVLAAAVYTAGCILSAAAPEIVLFLVGRVLQGVGAGWIVGLCYVAIGTVFPENLWARVLASVSGVWGAATLLSPLIGGLFAEAGLWRGAFLVFAVQGVGFGLAAHFLLSPARPQGASDKLPMRQLGVLTGGILSIAAAGLVAHIAIAVALGIAGIFLLGFFVRIDGRASAPLLPRSSGDVMSAAGSGYMMIFTLAAASIGFSVYGSAIMQVLFGTSPLLAGYILGVESMSWTLCALAVASLGSRWHGLFIKLGAIAVVIGVASLAFTMRTGPLAAIAAASVFLGGGFGLSWAFISQRIITSVKDSERALASSAIPTMQMIGYAAGSAGVGAIANFLGFADGIDAEAATRAGFWLFASFVPVGLVGVAAAWRLAACDPDQISLRADNSSLM
ncbi:MAG: MFS transporter [Parvibaculum sp.]|uniref:MFS transporter n=1 Tax=Parvibaculum sp. TaxID=2024848 RepID=UPI0025CF34BB|nr:MFS transporter [Parvibaculum sp.]MCE9650880.1 MFS transporter [Parvibaculum sp.]